MQECMFQNVEEKDRMCRIIPVGRSYHLFWWREPSKFGNRNQ